MSILPQNCDIHNYLKYYATLIKRNMLKDSNHCFDSLVIRLRCKDLKPLITETGPLGLQG